MLIDSYNGKSYIDETKITSMTIVGDIQFENGRQWKSEDEKAERVYSIWCNNTTNNIMDMQRLVFETKEKAEMALLEIHKKINESKKNVEEVEKYMQSDKKDYIDGFKDGCEYSLKLFKDKL